LVNVPDEDFVPDDKPWVIGELFGQDLIIWANRHLMMKAGRLVVLISELTI
jgi:hypothetical protein